MFSDYLDYLSRRSKDSCTLHKNGLQPSPASKLDYHWPTREAPYILLITSEKYEYQREAVRISVGNAWFVDFIKRNIIHSVINGDAIRLNSMKIMKTMFGQLGVSDVEHTVDDVAKIGLRQGEVNDEKLCVRISTSQWHVYTPWSLRIYSYDNLQAELKRNWTENRGSFVLNAKECRWTKARDFEQQEKSRQMPSIKAYFTKLVDIPHQIYEVCWNPMCMIDVYVANTDATFADFRLQDAEMIKAATDKAKEEFIKYNYRHPGATQNTVWEMFIGDIMLALKEKQRGYYSSQFTSFHFNPA